MRAASEGGGLGYLALELDLLVVAVRRVPLGKPGLAPEIPLVSAFAPLDLDIKYVTG